MQDITVTMLQFKEAIRHLWNTYFLKSDPGSWLEMQEAYTLVEIGLFRAIVLVPLSAAELGDEYRRQPLSWLLVGPAASVRELPIQIGTLREGGSTSYAEEIALVVDDTIELEFCEFFEWDPYGYLDLPYVKVRIVKLPNLPSAEGSFALIRQTYCRFLFAG